MHVCACVYRRVRVWRSVWPAPLGKVLHLARLEEVEAGLGAVLREEVDGEVPGRGLHQHRSPDAARHCDQAGGSEARHFFC